MEAGLQIFYCFMAVYGWTQWRVSLPDNSKFLVKHGIETNTLKQFR